ncbi:MAG: Mur ligase family protein [Pseudomonadota bacterium]
MARRPKSLVRRFGAFVRRRTEFNLAMLARRRNRNTRYVSVTGSSAKTTTCGLLDHILAPAAPTATLVVNNTLPAVARFLRTVTADHDFAVIETGIDGPDRMLHLARLIRPHVGIVTMIGLEHRKTMRSVDIVAAEKGILAEHLAHNGVALLNADDDKTSELEARANGRVIKFGRNKPADYRAHSVSAGLPNRLTLKISGPECDLALKTQLIGEHFWLPVTAAVACASHLGVPPDTIARQVASFPPPPDRCGLLELPGERTVVLDTFKAPQHSLPLAFDLVRTASAVHKRVIVGQLSDTTGSSRTAYRRAYRLAREVADEVIFVGEHAHRHNAPAGDIENGRVKEFREVIELAEYLKETAVPGELILLKSNAKLHLERAALAQVETVVCWERNCGLKTFCRHCEYYESPRQQRSDQQK